MKNSWIWAVVFALCTGCSGSEIENPTDVFAPAQRIIELNNKNLKEISGMSASRANPGLFWVHNDSGNEPEVYLIDTSLNIHLTCRLDGVENRDWEDIAIGPGPEDGKSYVYVGEIGDNKAQYTHKHIYRFEEPVLEDGIKELSLQRFDTITFRLEDKRKDTETLLIDPNTKALYVISKREKPVWLYELTFPQSTTDTLVAQRIMSLPFTQIVGGDIRSDARQVLLKNYEQVFFWRNDEPMTLPNLLRTTHFEVPYEIEPQGEALSWTLDGSGFYTLSEKNVGKSTYLYYYKDQTEKVDSPAETVSH